MWRGLILGLFGAAQEDAVWNRVMVPLQLFKASGTSLRKPQWGLIDTTALSPWNVMVWGLKQMRGIVIGSGSDGTKLQAQELVLVENLQVCGDIHWPRVTLRVADICLGGCG
jgi:charged multivesicular body protein 7